MAQKEQVISQGQKIFIRIAPQDPRSLMQGDYMALNFDFTPAIRAALDQPDEAGGLSQKARHALVVAQLDQHGIASIVRLANANAKESLASGQLLLPFKTD